MRREQMNLLIEILIVAFLIKAMGLNAALIWALYAISKLLGQLYIMWEEGLRQTFLTHFKKKSRR
jgi:hypothetical protein